MDPRFNKVRKRWYATHGSGSVRQEKYFKTKKEAVLWLASKTTASGELTQPDYPIKELAKQYLESLSERSLSHTRDVKLCIEEIIDTFNLSTLRDVTPQVGEQIKSHYRDLVSPSRINKKVGFLKSLMNYACKVGYIALNPLRNIDKVPVRHKEKRALLSWEIEEILTVANEVDPGMHKILIMLFNTGMRRNEAITLEWENIDFTKSMVRIYDKPHVVIQGEPFRCKRESRRVIPLKAVVTDMLAEKDKNTRWIFQNSEGNHMYNNFYRRFKKILAQTSIQRQEEVSIHTTRHTWISQMLHSGVPLKVVSVLAGHRNLTTTQKYAHLVGDAESLHLNINRMPDFGGCDKMRQKDAEQVAKK
ncbi:MAG: site-specific integrase [Planctomycetes bacterium]|nr:site-specific integrase [Planctomycetota bacterium]